MCLHVKVTPLLSVYANVLSAVQVEQYLMKAEDIHEDFRLWITAEPHPNFPIGLLQMGIKITNEAPVGMKAGLRASYQWVTQVTKPFYCCNSPGCCLLVLASTAEPVSGLQPVQIAGVNTGVMCCHHLFHHASTCDACATCC